jgi:5-methylthioadenosine/S-adenosylhomocysteine deaminase
MQHVDLLIHARWVVPVEPDETIYEHFSVAVHEGDIVDVLAQNDANKKYRATDTANLEDHALIPGLVNGHTHAAMSLFRGLADDLPLMDWLNHHIWPAEQQWMGPEFVHDGTALSIAEMIKTGTTCFNDMYFFADETARVCEQAGMRAVLGMIVIDFPSVWAANIDEYFSKGLQLHDELRSNDLLSTAFAPHAPYSVADEALQKIAALAEELDVPIHMHVHETAHEVNEALEKNGVRPLQRLDRLGLISPRLLAVHMTQLKEQEISLLSKNGAHVLHCPESNMKLASGFCPAAELLSKGINVAIGTDGAASNNDLDMLGEMRSAALLAKGISQDATALPAHTALKMATLNGARALGLEQHIGSLVVGKAADIVAIDMQHVSCQPVYNPVSQLVYACPAQQVSDVWIAGRRVLRHHQLTTLDESSILSKAASWRDKIQQSLAQAT